MFTPRDGKEPGPFDRTRLLIQMLRVMLALVKAWFD